jgi:hypothetical protein
MTRKSTTTIDKLDKLYKKKKFLETKKLLQYKTYCRTGKRSDNDAYVATKDELEKVIQEINNFEDM